MKCAYCEYESESDPCEYCGTPSAALTQPILRAQRMSNEAFDAANRTLDPMYDWKEQDRLLAEAEYYDSVSRAQAANVEKSKKG